MRNLVMAFILVILSMNSGLSLFSYHDFYPIKHQELYVKAYIEFFPQSNINILFTGFQTTYGMFYDIDITVSWIRLELNEGYFYREFFIMPRYAFDERTYCGIQLKYDRGSFYLSPLFHSSHLLSISGNLYGINLFLAGFDFLAGLDIPVWSLDGIPSPNPKLNIILTPFSSMIGVLTASLEMKASVDTALRFDFEITPCLTFSNWVWRLFLGVPINFTKSEIPEAGVVFYFSYLFETWKENGD